jgi:hemolysin-activating ACP:hemolysin acyltransferase
MFDAARQRIIGAVSLLLMDDPSLRSQLGILLYQEILPSIRHGQFCFFTNFDGLPVGFITWAYLSANTEARILSEMNPELHISEWNEGASLWIRRLHLSPALRHEGIQLCLSELFPNAKSFKVMLPRKQRVTAIEVQRDVVLRLVSRLYSNIRRTPSLPSVP